MISLIRFAKTASICGLGSAVEKIDDAGDHVEVTLDNGRHVRAEMLLFAAGRMGATSALNLDAVGLETDHRNRIKVDRKTYQTSVPHIYATGDVIGTSITGLDLVAAGPRGCLPCVGNTYPARKPVVSVWHLLSARDLDLRDVRGGTTGTWYPL